MPTAVHQLASVCIDISRLGAVFVSEFTEHFGDFIVLSLGRRREVNFHLGAGRLQPRLGIEAVREGLWGEARILRFSDLRLLVRFDKL